MVENKIKAALLRLLDGIKNGDGLVIATEIDLIDKLLVENRLALNPRVVHFLERRSYAKAMAFLDNGPDVAAGVCDRRK